MVLTNVYGVALTIRATLPHLLERGDGHFLVDQLDRRPPGAAGLALLGDQVGGDGDRRGAARGAAPDAREPRHPGDADRAGDDRHALLRRPPGRLRRSSDEDIARAVMFALEQPAGVDVNEILIRPTPAADLAAAVPYRASSCLLALAAGGDLELEPLAADLLAVLAPQRHLREETAAQRSLVLVSRPRLPPFMVSTNLLTGTSGTPVEDVAQAAALDRFDRGRAAGC